MRVDIRISNPNASEHDIRQLLEQAIQGMTGVPPKILILRNQKGSRNQIDPRLRPS